MSSKSSDTIYQIKVTLVDSTPPIWRRLWVPSTFSLAQLHATIQIAMGWSDSHLHQFEVNNQFYGIPDPAFDFDVKDENRIKLTQCLKQEKSVIFYEYDFGDSWQHKVLLEKILPFDKTLQLPQCIKGKRACPPEDCGGMIGYEDFLAVIQDPQHPEHEDMLEWFEEEFDAEYFSLEEINQELARFFRK